jgi:hypothetical protein
VFTLSEANQSVLEIFWTPSNALVNLLSFVPHMIVRFWNINIAGGCEYPEYSTSALRRMDGTWSGDSFLLGSSSTSEPQWLPQLLIFKLPGLLTTH